jgi:biopolymer transport protein TolQ
MDPIQATAAARPTLKSLPAVDRALLRAAAVEVNKLEHWIPFLATTASISPFIGLFGTVWGILIAFAAIAQTGSTNLNAVAPGIAEALITTAAGLLAAIPAVLFYNYFSQRVKIFASTMDDFAMEFLNIAERTLRRCRSCSRRCPRPAGGRPADIACPHRSRRSTSYRSST